MKSILVVLVCLATLLARGQEAASRSSGKTETGAIIERFTLTGGRTYDGIWDAAKSQIHIVSKTNHVGNLEVKPAEILARKRIGDGSKVVLNSDLVMAEKVLLLNQKNHTEAKARLAAAQQRRDTLHQTYAHKDLPAATYKAVMAQYKAADDELVIAQKAVEGAESGFARAQEAYLKAGGKKQYTLK